MSDFKHWCQRYGYEPDSAQAREDWKRARANLDALERAIARHDAREAIERAREQSREPDEPDDDLDDAPNGPR